MLTNFGIAPNLPFSDYITQCNHLIATTRTDLHAYPGINPEEIITANSPFELHPTVSNGKGILLIHGLLDSPFIMRDIGKRLAQQGYLVRAILLPGHGTKPSDLLNVTYHDWIQAARYGIDSFQNEVEKVYLCGFSTGASVAIYHALHHANLSGIVLLSPAIKIRAYLDFSTNWHRAISWRWERAKWLHLIPENDYAKYQSIPFNAAYQVYRLTRLIKKISKTKTTICPQFFIVSLADSTVSATASIKYFQQYHQANSRIMIYAKQDKHKNDPATTVRTSVYPELRIQEFSHIAIPVAPDNLHYGKHGDYINASHVEENNGTIYTGLNKFENMIHAFFYKYKMTSIKRQRLSFNPDFEFMMAEIEKFIT
jgi:esterase/lipase